MRVGGAGPTGHLWGASEGWWGRTRFVMPINCEVRSLQIT